MAEPITLLEVPPEIFTAFKDGTLTARIMERHRDPVTSKDGAFIIREVQDEVPTGNILKVAHAVAKHTTLGKLTPDEEASTGLSVESLLGKEFFTNLRAEGRSETVVKGYRQALLDQNGLSDRPLSVIHFENPQQISAEEAKLILESNKKAALNIGK